MTPAKKVAVKARRMYLGSSGSSSFRRRSPSKSDTTATGPMAMSLELPMKAYTSGGTKLLSENFNSHFILLLMTISREKEIEGDGI